jgi:hypothetical protein
MNTKAFEQTVENSLKSGQIGTPVAIRFNLQLTNEDQKLELSQVWCENFAKSIFQSDVKSKTCRNHVDGKQVSSITKFDNGTILSTTVGFTESSKPQLQFLLIGQDGIIQSDGLE